MALEEYHQKKSERGRHRPTMSSRAIIELLCGRGAHADPVACIEDISADLAARRVTGFPHSIGQLVFHMNYWMNYDLCRIRGQSPKYPEHNSESFPSQATPSDEEGWDRLRKEFSALLNDAATFAHSSREELDREIEPTHSTHKERASSLEATIWQLVAHNSYHIGQIAMIRRTLGSWPPRGGGDTW
jgi:uncharacterized damage-inducible protein DinB